MSSRSNVQDEATAFHEAAHAVAAVVLGVPGEIAVVSIEPDERTEGRVSFEREVQPTRETVDDYILQQLVGRFGEERKTAVPVAYETKRDYERAAQYACYFGIATRDEVPEGEIDAPFFTDYNDRARRFVEERWDAVQRVAQALLTRRQLSGFEIRQIVETVANRR